MALEYNIVLETDSPETLRVSTNDNFQMVINELNQIGNYFDVDSESLTGMLNVETSQIKVNSNKLIINSTEFTINDDIDLNGDLNLNGNFILGNINPTLINNSLPEVITNGGFYNVGSVSTVPSYSVYKVTSSDVSGLYVDLFSGLNGQQITFLFMNDPVGVETKVMIRKSSSGSAELYLPSGMTKIVLDEIGQSVTLMYIDDGWMLISGNLYSFE